MDQFVGDIQLFALDFPPYGWMKCEGQTLSTSEYQVLFSLLGTRFGGNGQTTFCLPDLRKALPIQGMGMSYCIAYYGLYPMPQ
ncbi:tail fiber protein [Lachnospiraceae bacterium MD1]|jgi:microcystin-dependent protein|uniref:Tail fiber protein n=1 Tax=Variimorphobacter saccharofermentans TaxID=2755051 RepID=A0A839JYZ7_9FIRM|nr:tail fiber protein [Variimorphobacter saccharofermentans]MBB2182438.1 tail fiber protein [Variimorphobacter saccharofermentans]